MVNIPTRQKLVAVQKFEINVFFGKNELKIIFLNRQLSNFERLYRHQFSFFCHKIEICHKQCTKECISKI